jgi:hypothetical protein
MSLPPNARKRPSVHITLHRAARLLRLVRFLSDTPRNRETILAALGIGLRTFYRELELLNRCGVKIRNKDKLYTLQSTAEQAEGRLPFPDPQLSFSEIAELARCPGEAGQRMASLYASVVDDSNQLPRRPRSGRRGSSEVRKK